MVLLVSDADNTLWDTNAVYAEGHLILLERTEEALRQTTDVVDRLSFVRAIDQQLAILHGHDLGYPPELLALGIAEAIAGAPPEESARRAFEGSASQASIPAKALGQCFLSHVQNSAPNLRAGVSETMSHLHDMGVLTIVATEGKAQRCRGILAQYGLVSYVTKVIEGKKTAHLFSEIAAIYGKPTVKFVVGDQLDRDIVPARAAGYYTIYFPGDFNPSWDQRNSTQPDFVISSFAEVWQIIALVGVP